MATKKGKSYYDLYKQAEILNDRAVEDKNWDRQEKIWEILGRYLDNIRESSPSTNEKFWNAIYQENDAYKEFCNAEKNGTEQEREQAEKNYKAINKKSFKLQQKLYGTKRSRRTYMGLAKG